MPRHPTTRTSRSATLTLTPDQQAVLTAIRDWLANPDGSFLTVGGYAGTGKTTLIAELRRVLASDETQPIRSVAFCCYTGKAASVLRQKLDDAGALETKDSCGTIHSLIYKPVVDDAGSIIRWDRVPELSADLVVIDEGSMVNEPIWRDLLAYHIPILAFGDHGQLPPIEGSFSLMTNPRLTLQTIVRQAAGNPIIQLSEQVRLGEPIPFGRIGEVIRKYNLGEEESREVFESLATDSERDSLCICGRNKTRVHLNRRIRTLRGFSEETPRTGDTVICLKNSYTKMIFNGMFGWITEIAPDEEHWYQATITMEDAGAPYQGRILRHQFGAEKTLRGEQLPAHIPLVEREFGDLFDFGYAVTAHKAQGSEAKRVILFEERMYGYDDVSWARWLYTAVTRARAELVIFANQ